MPGLVNRSNIYQIDLVAQISRTSGVPVHSGATVQIKSTCTTGDCLYSVHIGSLCTQGK